MRRMSQYLQTGKPAARYCIAKSRRDHDTPFMGCRLRAAGVKEVFRRKARNGIQKFAFDTLWVCTVYAASGAPPNI